MDIVPEDQDHDNDEIELDRFKLPKNPYPTMMFVAARDSGKSHQMVRIAKMFDVHMWAAWCGNKDTEDFWGDRFGSNASVYGPDDRGVRALQRIIEDRDERIRVYKKIHKRPWPKELSMGLIFDDVTGKRKFRSCALLEDLFSNGRHYKLVILMSVQWSRQILPAMRANSDCVFFLRNPRKSVETIYNEFISVPHDFKTFQQLLSSVTKLKKRDRKLYNALVYTPNLGSERIAECYSVFTDKYINPEDVELGSKQWRQYNIENYCDKSLEYLKRKEARKQRKKRLNYLRKQQETRRMLPAELIELDQFDDTDDEGDADADERDGADSKIGREAEYERRLKKRREGRKSHYHEVEWTRKNRPPLRVYIPLDRPPKKSKSPTAEAAEASRHRHRHREHRDHHQRRTEEYYKEKGARDLFAWDDQWKHQRDRVARESATTAVTVSKRRHQHRHRHRDRPRDQHQHQHQHQHRHRHRDRDRSRRHDQRDLMDLMRL